MYALCSDKFDISILDIINTESDEANLQAQRRDAEYRRRVIVSFFEYGKLKSIPTQRKKKRIALEEIVEALAWDRIYTEKEVNIIIADFHEDFCTIRRDLISEKLMGREDNRYWRLKI